MKNTRSNNSIDLMQNIKVKIGDKISHKGKNYRMNKSISLSVTPERKSDIAPAPKAVIEPPKEEPKAEQKSDPGQAIDKATVLALLQEKIDVLEKHENDLLMDGVFNVEDDLELIDQQRGENYKTATYAATTVHLMDLKSLFKKIKNLS